MYLEKPPDIGMIIYESYAPAKYGKIIKVIGKSLYASGEEMKNIFDVIVRWRNGDESKASTICLKSYQALIDDHKRKYENHLKTLEKAKSL